MHLTPLYNQEHGTFYITEKILEKKEFRNNILIFDYLLDCNVDCFDSLYYSCDCKHQTIKNDNKGRFKLKKREWICEQNGFFRFQEITKKNGSVTLDIKPVPANSKRKANPKTNKHKSVRYIEPVGK